MPRTEPTHLTSEAIGTIEDGAYAAPANVTKEKRDAYDIARHLVEVAREARLKFVVFRRDGEQPGEAAPLARALWMGIPELASRAGVPIDRTKEGYPANIIPSDKVVRERLAIDVMRSREIAQWLDGHITPEMRRMFSPAQRGDNIVDKAIGANAAVNGEQRTDAFEQERREAAPSHRRDEPTLIVEERSSPRIDHRARNVSIMAHLSRQGMGG